MKHRSLLFMLAVLCSACSKYGCRADGTIMVSAMCNDTNNQTIALEGTYHFTDAELDELVARSKARLCVDHGGVFHMREVQSF